MQVEQEIGYAYILSLGTPYPVGTQLNNNGRIETIVSYKFVLPDGLIAVTDIGSELSDYAKLSNSARKRDIQNFLSSNMSRKIQINKTKKNFYTNVEVF